MYDVSIKSLTEINENIKKRYNILKEFLNKSHTLIKLYSDYRKSIAQKQYAFLREI